MVLADLGSKLSVALRKMANHTVIDQEVLDSMLQDICKALLQADVNVAQARAAARPQRGAVRLARSHALAAAAASPGSPARPPSRARPLARAVRR